MIQSTTSQKNTAARGIGAAKKAGDEQEAQRILEQVAELVPKCRNGKENQMRQLVKETDCG